MKIDLICYLFDSKSQDLGIEKDDLEVKCCVDLKEIAFVRQCIDEGEDAPSKINSAIFFKSGGSAIVKKPYNELHQIWKNI